MVLASFFFATMAVGIKVASTSFSLPELVFYRGVGSVIFMAVVLRARRTPVATPVPWMHAWRAVIGVFSLATWFYASAHLPLATAMTLNYMSGVWVAAFVVGGALLYGQSSRQGPLMVTVLASFAGVVMMLRPTLDQNQSLHLARLVSRKDAPCFTFPSAPHWPGWSVWAGAALPPGTASVGRPLPG